MRVEEEKELKYLIFYHRYSVLGFKDGKRQKFANVREEASALAIALNLGNYQIGKSKIFFKSPRAVSNILLFFLLSSFPLLLLL